ncbi:uncharacterized protein BO97DRAFT_443543 [Aspergillus homomorphus CBS 101889]|uniref:Dockerin type 1 n=1 Tax=Aspergillus homomorphus (strain CBS 101889) TaxID=1450537 RepID=A0A395HWB6_ASPHC|nr:hypothetical protein BO97DRAFT_443543 [Aspergillus homomorphus CBS 101889]RAL11819.1 hypothetical protein BO97DRAFT_443543 [Aspergillus homomorphus CBS 101889]
MLTPTITPLAHDPDTTHRLNACAYQQSALTTIANTQYAAFYTASPDPATRFVTLARRNLSGSEWHLLTFTDYAQRTDDGHNTVSLGICAGDGTIHLAFDHHCDTLHYRISRPGLASDTRAASWTPSAFGAVQSHLPGCDPRTPLEEITYPRFVPAGDNLFFEYRIGRAGAGSEALYLYTPAPTSNPDPNPNPGTTTTTTAETIRKTGEFHPYTPAPAHTPSSRPSLIQNKAIYLQGQNNNPYPNGLTYHVPSNSLHLTWTNRLFLPYPGANSPDSTAHKAQAGPNGPENNEGLYYVSAVLGNLGDDGVGVEWRGCRGDVLAFGSFYPHTLSRNGGLAREGHGVQDEGEESLNSQDPKLRVRDLPPGSGIMNQEAQFVDAEGGVHVLNRENTRGQGVEWVYYFWSGSRDEEWESSVLEGVGPGELGPRGKVVVYRRSVWFVLPVSQTGEVVVARWARERGLEVVWRGMGFDGEPLVDEPALEAGGILSVLMLRRDAVGRQVVVVAFDLERLV